MKVSNEELDALLKANLEAGDFVEKTFQEKFYQSGIHQIVGNIRFNIDDLQGFKKPHSRQFANPGLSEEDSSFACGEFRMTFSRSRHFVRDDERLNVLAYARPT